MSVLPRSVHGEPPGLIGDAQHPAGTPPIGFLVIGAPKAGTTSLFEYMRAHPEIHMPAEKEVYFFNVDRNYRRGWDWYSRAVRRGAPAGTVVCGEATTEYLSGAPYTEATEAEPDVPHAPHDLRRLEELIPRRIKRALPDVKLICVLRDPVERAYSHHQMMALGGVDSRAFGDVIDELLSPTTLQLTRAVRTRENGYVINGEYARLLSGYLRVFSRDQMMVVFSDELAGAPTATLARIFAFAGVSADFKPDNVGTRYRQAASRQRLPGLNLITWQRAAAGLRPARAAWHALPDPVRHRIDHAYSVANYRVELWNAWRGETQVVMAPTTRRRLIEHFRPDSQALAEILGRDVPWLAEWQRAGC